MEAPRFVPYEATPYSSTPVWPEGVPFPVELDAHREARFKLRTWLYGITRIEGLAVEKSEGGVIVHGVRSLERPRESGYQYEGRVSVGGEKRRAFTSSQLFFVNGKLANVAILYVCSRKVRAPDPVESPNE